MKLKPTIVNHFNPCFWTAYWNFNYLEAKRKGEKISNPPREQTVYNLNIKANKILLDKTKNIFVQKRAGIAEITSEKEYQKLKENASNQIDFPFEEDNLILDFENHFTEFENLSKESIEKTIVFKKIETIEDKTFIALFILMQSFRNHRNLDDFISKFIQEGKSKLDLFIELKNSLTNADKLASSLIPIVFCKWKIYSTKKPIFPLTDHSVLNKNGNIFFPISPDLLIEIKIRKKTEEICSYSNKISKWKYFRFKNRSILYSTREIIFGDDEILKDWKRDKRLPTT